MKLTGQAIIAMIAILTIGASVQAALAQSAPAPGVAIADPGPVGAATTTALFAHVAVGGGFTTTFTLINTGSDALAGSLILTKADGTPMTVSLAEPSVSPNLAGSRELAVAASSSVTIQPGGTAFVTASPANPNDAFSGWARVESSGGTLGGVATFSFTQSGALQTIAGVLSGSLVSSATIPVDDDVSQNRFTGYAVANPSSNPVTIKVVEVPADGNAANAVTLSSVTLGPLKQSASFLFQDPKAAQTFRGSVVLIGQNGATFAVVALVQVQGPTGQPLYTAIPVIPSNAPNIN